MSKQEFIVQKAKNFRKWIESFNPPQDVLAYMEAFQESMIIPTIHLAIVPAVDSGKHVEMVEDLASKLSLSDGDKGAFTDKCTRYIEMFAELVSS